jgi:prevent-host-death family protein
MSDRDDRPARVGVRELRQNLSVYLDRVKEGEALDVTERGQVVARLSPNRGNDSLYDQMVEDGRISRARGDLTALGSPLTAPGRPLSELLRELRDEETA